MNTSRGQSFSNSTPRGEQHRRRRSAPCRCEKRVDLKADDSSAPRGSRANWEGPEVTTTAASTPQISTMTDMVLDEKGEIKNCGNEVHRQRPVSVQRDDEESLCRGPDVSDTAVVEGGGRTETRGQIQSEPWSSHGDLRVTVGLG